MKRLSLEGALWLNRRELAQPKYAELHNVFVGYDGIFEHFQIGINCIREIQTFSWDKSNESCDELHYANGKEFRTVSTEYVYEFDQMDGSMQFQLQFYRKCIGKEVECSIFLKILEVTPGIESVTTEMDIICHCDGAVHRSLMRKQKLMSHGSTKGIVVFRSKNVNSNSSISWKFAIRMDPKQFRIRINDRFLKWDQSLADRHDAQEVYEDDLVVENDTLSVWSGGEVSWPPTNMHERQDARDFGINFKRTKSSPITRTGSDGDSIYGFQSVNACSAEHDDYSLYYDEPLDTFDVLKEQLREKEQEVISMKDELRDLEKMREQYQAMKQEYGSLQETIERMEIENRRIREQLAVTKDDPPECNVFSWFKI